MPLPASIEARDYSEATAGEATAGEATAGEATAGEATAGEATAGEPTPVGWDDDDLDAVAIAGPATTPLEPLSLVAGGEADGGRLDKWLAARLPAYSRSRIQRWIADGGVRIGDRVAATRDPVWKGDAVRVVPRPSDDENAFAAEDVALDIVHEDDTILVIDKRAGVVVHPATGNWHWTVLNGLLHHHPALASVPRAGIVHRLDKDTTGLMVVAKTLEAQTDLVRQLQARSVGRTYVAVVHGTPAAEGRIAWPIGRDPRDRTRMKAFPSTPGGGDGGTGSKPAATRYRTLGSVTLDGRRSVSLVVCRLESGRTHQIRVHLQALGHPLVGDATYGGAQPNVAFERQALHAWHLRLIHPASGQSRDWTAALPDDLESLCRRLGFDTATLGDPSLTTT